MSEAEQLSAQQTHIYCPGCKASNPAAARSGTAGSTAGRYLPQPLYAAVEEHALEALQAAMRSVSGADARQQMQREVDSLKQENQRLQLEITAGREQDEVL